MTSTLCFQSSIACTLIAVTLELLNYPILSTFVVCCSLSLLIYGLYIEWVEDDED